MFDSIKDYASSALGTAVQRVKNPAFGAFSLSWCAFNWKQILYLFLSDTDVLDKINYISSTSNWKMVIGYPVLSVIILCGFLPWVNYLITTWQIKPLDNTDSIDNQRKAKTIRRSTRLQRLQAKHDVTYDKVKTGAEKDIQAMKEQIAQSQDRMGELTAELTAKDNELSQVKEQLSRSETALENAVNSINKSASEYDSLVGKYNMLNSEFSDYKTRYAIASNGGLSEKSSGFGANYNIVDQLSTLKGLDLGGVRGVIGSKKPD